MSAFVLQRLTTLTVSVKQFGRIPNLVQCLPSSLPSLKPTVSASQVPLLFREPYILTGYRPLHQNWYCYLFSLFQKHNETLNVWSHLLAVPILLLRWWSHFGALGNPLDISVLPLCLFIASVLICYSCSSVAHMFQSHSERAHYCVFFMDYIGVAVYQYGCALGHYFYTSAPEWRASIFGQYFLPGTAFLGLMSCLGCCIAKSRYHKPYPMERKICQLIPSSLAYFLGISPVVHRLLTGSWEEEPSLNFHALQILFFFSSAVFFSCPIPEYFFPGKFDFFGHGHQLFHVLLSLTTLCQLEAFYQEYEINRENTVDIFGESQIWWASVFFLVLAISSLFVGLASMKYMQNKLNKDGKKTV
ncbi:membrane progestin receptor beta [Boleophthalmus pectinirostris]|uniref:membrane progestin receptor beta n=1 Tax=Boleophthalmus pectinirostris TaxID=150288 RepID=UPI000A1C6147|nr:membrane progestin receptor beta [Boleophthalmus pectinirostris]